MSEFISTENMSESDYGSHEDEIAMIEKNGEEMMYGDFVVRELKVTHTTVSFNCSVFKK